MPRLTCRAFSVRPDVDGTAALARLLKPGADNRPRGKARGELPRCGREHHCLGHHENLGLSARLITEAQSVGQPRCVSRTVQKSGTQQFEGTHDWHPIMGSPSLRGIKARIPEGLT